MFIQRCVVANVLKDRLIFLLFLSFSECERCLFEITSDGLFDSFSRGSSASRIQFEVITVGREDA